MLLTDAGSLGARTSRPHLHLPGSAVSCLRYPESILAYAAKSVIPYFLGARTSRPHLHLPGSTLACAAQGGIPSAFTLGARTSHFDKTDLPKLQRYARFFNNDDSMPGYYQEHSGNKTFNKVKFANDICQHFTKGNLSQVLDLEERMADVVDIIKKWNEG